MSELEVLRELYKEIAATPMVDYCLNTDCLNCQWKICPITVKKVIVVARKYKENFARPFESRENGAV